MSLSASPTSAPAPELAWWRAFWAENDECLYGLEAAKAAQKDPRVVDALPVQPPITSDRPRVPVLVELGEDWIVDRTGVSYRRYIQDFEFQQQVRAQAEQLLQQEAAFHLKPKVDSSSLLHGSIYGCPINYPPDSTPWLEHIIHSPEEVDRLIHRMEKVDLSQAGLVPWFINHYRQLGRHYRHRILHDPTSVHGPGTLLSFFFGINNLCLYLCDEPDLIKALLALVGEITVAYSRLVRRETGAPTHGVGIFDDVAGLISARQFDEFFLPVYERVYGELAPSPGDERFYHNDARVSHLLDRLRGLGVNGINPDPDTSPALIRKKLPGAVLFGGIPPLLLKDGTPEQITHAARAALRVAGEGGGLVLTTAGSINMGTPLANLQALCQAAERYGRYAGGVLVRDD